MHAGLGQTLLALVPLATLVLAVAYRQERLHGAAVIGSVLGLIGVAVISTAPLQESMSTTALVAMLGSVLCFAQAAVLVRPIRSVHPVVMNTVAMFTGAAVLLAGSGLLGESHVLPSRMATWIALGYVVVIGSVVVFLLYVYVLQHWSASRASYVMVIIPFITVALSAWLDGERIGRGLVVGGLLVLAGVYFGALRRPSPALTPQARARTSSPSTSLPRNR
jgi:drug/metabolite transporter (DMT)-like permease